MTYLQFHLVFLIPVILVLSWFQHRGQGVGWVRGLGLAVIALIAFVYTTPWDNYLVARGVWWYGADRVLMTIGYVPIEEYAFFILQPILTGLWLFYLIGRDPIDEPPTTSSLARYVGGALYLVVGAAGAYALQFDSTLYLGLILAWAGPVLAFQWFIGGHRLWGHRRLWAFATVLPTLYLWLADYLAIGKGIWYISEVYTTGLMVLGLPMEEALFFLVTNLLVVQGLMLFLLVVRAWQRHGVWALLSAPVFTVPAEPEQSPAPASKAEQPGTLVHAG
ncbi:MAG: lycopene cyclase domain-containing protein [Bacteroidota bacterium]